jgi:hypothetical protein
MIANVLEKINGARVHGAMTWITEATKAVLTSGGK